MNDIVENIKKETDVFSKAKLIKHLLEKENYRVVDLAKKLSITPSYLCHLNRLNRLPDIIIDGYYSKLIKLSHLFIISRVKDENKLIQIYEKVLSENLTIKQTEDQIREIIYEVSNKGDFISKKTKDDLINKVQKKYPDANFQMSQTRTKSKILIEIKGSLDKTSRAAKQIINGLIGEEG